MSDSALTVPGSSLIEGLLALKATLAPDLTNGELQLFAAVCERSGLDPFARQIYAVKRQGRMAIQTGIDGYRSIAARTGEYDGQDEPDFGPWHEPGSGSCSFIYRHPESATVRVYRKGVGRPIAATAFWHEYVPEAGPSGRGDLMWRRMPHVMISKVAEALALRKAFPWDPTRNIGIGSDIYTEDEMEQADKPAPLAERITSRAARVVTVEGMTLAAFRLATQHIETEQIAALAHEMYPDAERLSDLSGPERQTLFEALPVAEEQEIEDYPAESEAGVSEALTASGAIPGVEVRPAYCGDESPLSEGVVCDQPADHRGVHRAGGVESWPRK